MPPLLQIQDLHVSFDTEHGVVQAVTGVSLQLQRGEVLGLVGESGCGKSATAMSIPRLLPLPAARLQGAIRFDGRDLVTLPVAELRLLRGRRIGVIFQDPMTSLSPLHRVGDQIAEVVQLHARVSRATAHERALAWLAEVGIPDPASRSRAYPHELSGGMQQRVLIAMALILEPNLIIADEPTTALDVTIQAQVLALLRRLHRGDAGVLLITHDMGVVWEMCTRVAVMYAGEIVEEAPAAAFFAAPQHPYARALLDAMPSMATRGQPLRAIPGQVPSPLAWPAGCRFRDRCACAVPRCATHPPLLPCGDGRTARCWRVEVASGVLAKPPVLQAEGSGFGVGKSYAS
jgi:peptide/nickel transport system ATP-binding protein/oligopeptide transport system ATP-binding protein